MQIIPFAPKAPALRQQQVSSINAALSSGVSAGGFPVISIKGKVFHIVRNEERTLVTKPGEDDPAPSLEVVIVAANPSPSRVFYAKGYEEGSAEKPTCYSNNGKSPEADAQSPQAKSCATCIHSQYGSKVSESGQKGFACANSRRIAVVPVGQLNDPMLVRIPGATLKTLAQYAKELDGHGYAFSEVVTKVGFDYSVAHPALTFRAVGVLPSEALASVNETTKSELVQQIIGTIPTPSFEPAHEVPASVSALPSKVAPKPDVKVAPKPDVKVNAETSDELESVIAKAASKPKAKVKVEEPKVETVAALGDDIDALLDGVDFDA